ncbi:MAG: hypothetical protein L6Q29_03960 [Candidatus Pacebacteria bacterium]|nr:hypothetical protein [Candidatus Paceibacterota bacterium]NUQ57287.1 hypothetical protein [Candidatus Paceibacter sp.]
MKNTEEKTEIVNIRKETENKVIVESRTGKNILESTVYIFPKDIFISRRKETPIDKK